MSNSTDPRGLPENEAGNTAGFAGATPVKRVRSRRWPAWLAIALVLGGGCAWYFAKGSAVQAESAWKTATVTRGDVVQSVTASGTISAIKTVTVGSQVSGQITALMADYNSVVTNGQIVAQLDPSTYEQSLVQAEADLANANAALMLAKLTYNRAEQLDREKAKPHSELEKAEAELKQAEATVKSREAALKKAQVDLERTTIYSPIDGVVISRAVDVGQTVAASFNAPTLFTIAKDLRDMRIEAAVSEADIGGVMVGQPVQFTVDAFPGLTFDGTVSQVRFEPSTNQNVVTYVCIVGLRNEELKLRPGMTANATIITAEKRNVLRVPNAALRFTPPVALVTKGPDMPSAPGGAAGKARQPSELPPGAPAGGLQTPGMALAPGVGEAAPKTRDSHKTVYVVSDETAGGFLRKSSVLPGLNDGSYTEIQEGLAEGETVVTGSAQAGKTVVASSSRTSNPFSMRGGPPPR